MYARDSVGQAIAGYGIEATFGVAGDANLFLIDALVRTQGIAYYSAAHEAGAVMMADGYGRVRGSVGIASVTHGPGLTNTITALVEAVRNRSRLVVLCGDTPASKPFHLQNIDQRELVKATGARFEPIRSADTAAADTLTALRIAAREELPVVVNMPLDLLESPVLADAAVPARINAAADLAQPRVVPDGADLDRALGIIAAARRPVVLAGRGAVRSGARPALLQLAEMLGAPLATTLLAKDWFRGAAGNIGICGTLSGDTAGDLLAKSDCIVAFGAALTPHTTANGDLVRDTAVVQCDLRPSAFDRFGPVEARLLGDARATAEAMIEALANVSTPTTRFRAQLTPPEPALAMPARPDGRLDPLGATLAIEGMLPPERTVVLDAGRYMGLPMRHISVPDPEGFIFTCNFGSIGLGTGNAVGAAVARRDRPTVAFVGDGGFMMGGIAEFNSAVRHRLDLVLVVYNDRSYGAEYIQLERAGLPTALSEFAWPDLADTARAMGGEAVTCATADDLPAVAKAIDGRTTPLLIDLRLDPAIVPPIQ
ncbi:MAG TPA: thiamine pyrophosphate-binding protein [Pseudonocardia sp.]|jgi:thiamine pyrophosphate-dependent acetolactate synthase large subunit-like protein